MKAELEKYRQVKGTFGSKPGSNYGLFYIPSPIEPEVTLKVICGPMDSEWQHVSVSAFKRCPKWSEMSIVKDLFWNDEDTVVQFHPKKSEYVNNHPNVLHLWKKKDEEFELPPSILVGVKKLDPEQLSKVLKENGIEAESSSVKIKEFFKKLNELRNKEEL